MNPTEQRHLAELRSLLAKGASPQTFTAITARFPDGTLSPGLLTYLLDHFERWPADVRRAAPEDWQRLDLQGQDICGMALVNAFVWDQPLAHEALARLRELSITHLALANTGLPEDTLRALAGDTSRETFLPELEPEEPRRFWRRRGDALEAVELDRWEGTYRDVRGTEVIVIETDGISLSTSIRGFSFEGDFFDDFGVPDVASEPLFELLNGRLSRCTFSYQVPMVVESQERVELGRLDVRFDIGSAGEQRRRLGNWLELSLTCEHGTFTNGGRGAWFEHSLLDIDARLPGDLTMRACITCEFADSSPYGHNLFGGVLCFRHHKDAIRRVTDSNALMEIEYLADRVQETWSCPDWERRTSPTGYLG